MDDLINTEQEEIANSYPAKRSKWTIAGFIILSLLILVVLYLAVYGGMYFYHFHWGDGLMPSNTYKPENLVHILINTDGGKDFDLQYFPEAVIVAKTPDGENYMYIWLEK